jgi:hypothetical protein
MSIFDRLRRKKNEINKDLQKIDLEKPEKPNISHKPEPKGVDTEIQKNKWKVADKILNRYEIKRMLPGGIGVSYVAIDREWYQMFANCRRINVVKNLWRILMINFCFGAAIRNTNHL